MAPRQLSNKEPDGCTLGQSATDPISFYGATPVAQRAAAIQATSLLSASTYVTVGSNLATALTEIANTLAGLGLWKGAA